MISRPMHPPGAGPRSGGINMLMPSAYDDIWTSLDDGVFNEYPGRLGIETTSATGYQNPNRSSTIPIGPNTQPYLALVAINPKRTSILMQNNSTADPTTDDIAPTFYFNFGAQAQVGIGIGLAPGVGLVLDNNVQADSLYVTIGPSVNTSDSVVIQGAVLETSSTD
jgi:hypothetical protein